MVVVGCRLPLYIIDVAPIGVVQLNVKEDWLIGLGIRFVIEPGSSVTDGKGLEDTIPPLFALYTIIPVYVEPIVRLEKKAVPLELLPYGLGDHPALTLVKPLSRLKLNELVPSAPTQFNAKLVVVTLEILNPDAIFGVVIKEKLDANVVTPNFVCENNRVYDTLGVKELIVVGGEI